MQYCVANINNRSTHKSNYEFYFSEEHWSTNHSNGTNWVRSSTHIKFFFLSFYWTCWYTGSSVGWHAIFYITSHITLSLMISSHSLIFLWTGTPGGSGLSSSASGSLSQIPSAGTPTVSCIPDTQDSKESIQISGDITDSPSKSRKVSNVFNKILQSYKDRSFSVLFGGGGHCSPTSFKLMEILVTQIESY